MEMDMNMDVETNREIDLKFTRGPLLEINKKIKSICDNKLEIAIYKDIETDTELQSVSLYDDISNPDFVICLNYITPTKKKNETNFL
jgi:hypothetical protein